MANITVAVSMPEEDKAIITKWAKRHDMTVSQVIRKGVKMYIREEIMKEKERRKDDVG